MQNIKQQKIIFIFLGGISFILISFIIVLGAKNTNAKEANAMENTTEIGIIDVKKEIYHVDIKGAIKNPGVYEVNSDAIVNDVIKLAGGLASGGTTKNINLSKHVYDEMVIYVFKKSEITTSVKNEITCKTEVIEVNNCPIQESSNKNSNIDNNGIDNNSVNTNPDNNKKLININTADKNELMNISGIGESKANAIIDYRSKTPFKTIEDIKNISGIGDAVFDKIKDLITV